MNQELIKHLRTEVKLATWEMLQEHHDRGALFLIDNDLDLATVGAAIASDEADQVKSWLSDSKLILTKDLAWDEESEQSFVFIIVQPYVIIQRVNEI